MNSLKIVRNTGVRMILNRSRIGSAIVAVFYLGFFTVWYSSIIGSKLESAGLWTALTETVDEDKASLLFLLAPVLFVTQVWEQIRNALFGESFELLKASGVIKRNNKIFAKFSDISAVQVREIEDSDGDSIYRLSLLLHSGVKLFIESTSSHNKVYALADDLSHMIGVDIKSKS